MSTTFLMALQQSICPLESIPSELLWKAIEYVPESVFDLRLTSRMLKWRIDQYAHLQNTVKCPFKTTSTIDSILNTLRALLTYGQLNPSCLNPRQLLWKVLNLSMEHLLDLRLVSRRVKTLTEEYIRHPIIVKFYQISKTDSSLGGDSRPMYMLSVPTEMATFADMRLRLCPPRRIIRIVTGMSLVLYFFPTDYTNDDVQCLKRCAGPRVEDVSISGCNDNEILTTVTEAIDGINKFNSMMINADSLLKETARVLFCHLLNIAQSRGARDVSLILKERDPVESEKLLEELSHQFPALSIKYEEPCQGSC